MKQYIDLIKDILLNGNSRTDRTNTGTISVFGRQLRFNLEHGFPLITTKRVDLRFIIEELIWFLAGSTSNVTLENKGVTIWNEWALEEDSSSFKRGDLGPIYGKQWRDWSHEGSKAQPELSIKERLALIFTDSALRHVKSVLSDNLPESEEYAHTLLTSWGVPGGSKGKKVYDQIEALITGLKNKPYSRRHLVSSWNVPYLPDEAKTPQENVVNGKQALPACHTLFQFYVEDIPFDKIKNYITNKKRLFSFKTQSDLTWASCGSAVEYVSDMNGSCYSKYPENYVSLMLAWCNENNVKTKRLSCQLYQRSQDTCLGAPYNIASYSLLLMMIAQVTNMVAGDYIHTIGDAHIYKNHIEKAKEQISREPFALPTMSLNPEVTDIFSFKLTDFILDDYKHHPRIIYPIAI